MGTRSRAILTSATDLATTTANLGIDPSSYASAQVYLKDTSIIQCKLLLLKQAFQSLTFLSLYFFSYYSPSLFLRFLEKITETQEQKGSSWPSSPVPCYCRQQVHNELF